MPLKNRVRLLVSLPFLFALLTLEVCRRTCIRRLAEKGFTPRRACVCVWLCEWCVRVSFTPTALNRWILCKRKTRSSLKSRAGTWSVRDFNNVAFRKRMGTKPGSATRTTTRNFSSPKCSMVDSFCKRLLNYSFFKIRRKVVYNLGRIRLKGIAKNVPRD